MSWEVAELDRRMAGLMQTGVIDSVDYGDPGANPPRPPRCRVRVGDWVSALLPWKSGSAGGVSVWAPPSIGEQAMLLSPSGDTSGGFVIAGFPSDQHGQLPDQSPNKTVIKFPDGGRVSYDHAGGALTVSGATSLTITASGAVSIQADSITLNADVTIEKTLHVRGAITGDATILDASGNSNHHSHG